MIKRLREEWMYWRYRTITRRWQLLKPKLRLRRPMPQMPAAARARGTAMYMRTSSTNARGLGFVAVSAAALAIFNTVLPALSSTWTDLLLFAGMAYLYMRYAQI